MTTFIPFLLTPWETSLGVPPQEVPSSCNFSAIKTYLLKQSFVIQIEVFSPQNTKYCCILQSQRLQPR